MGSTSTIRPTVPLTGAVLLMVAAACGGDDSGDGIADRDGDALAAEGEQVFEENRCGECHSTSGQDMTGPHLDGIYGQEVELSDGSSVTVDDEYLERSIRDPGADVVEGFTPVMPDFDLEDEDVTALVAYIRSLTE